MCSRTSRFSLRMSRAVVAASSMMRRTSRSISRIVSSLCSGSLETDVPRSLPEVAGDAGRLQQVLMNLALNALDATPAGGRVRIAAEADESGLVLSVDDSGPGVSPESAERLFEPFFTTKPQGSGLGLPIVHAIVTQHGGEISVEKSPLGGARFAVRLPAAHRPGA